MDDLYPMIRKRTSFHVFPESHELTEIELMRIEKHFSELIALIDDIRIKFKIVPKTETTCKRGEYCILAYSEKKPNYLQNIGYVVEQLDLWLAGQNIGVCWYGMGRTKEKVFDNLHFVIMLAIAKQDESSFRRDYAQSKRKQIEKLWEGSERRSLAEDIRYAPSACNSQPWKVVSKESGLEVYRVKGQRSIMPAMVENYFNQIDIGIFLLFLELSLRHQTIRFKRTLYSEERGEYPFLTARYDFFDQ